MPASLVHTCVWPARGWLTAFVRTAAPFVPFVHTCIFPSAHTCAWLPGTPFFIAPEVTRGDFYTEKCDLFSFALLCCACMPGVDGDIRAVFDQTGTLRLGKPYKNLSPAEKAKLRGNYVIHKHANGWRVPLKQWGWPKEFEELVCSCWHEDMDKRPTFEQVMRTLESWKADMFDVN